MITAAIVDDRAPVEKWGIIAVMNSSVDRLVDEPVDQFADHQRQHRSGRAGWLRAAVLGANDGIVSLASLLVGVAASSATRPALLVAGVAGMSAGALSMAVGEFVSVGSQRDAEIAERAMEEKHQAEHPEFEFEELVRIYEGRGVERALAEGVAAQLMARDPIGSHLRDELGLTDASAARPGQAAGVSAASFLLGSSGPVVATILAGRSVRLAMIAVVALVMLAVSGALGAAAGGASRSRAAFRVMIGGGLAMAAAAGIGRIAGSAIT